MRAVQKAFVLARCDFAGIRPVPLALLCERSERGEAHHYPIRHHPVPIGGHLACRHRGDSVRASESAGVLLAASSILREPLLRAAILRALALSYCRLTGALSCRTQCNACLSMSSVSDSMQTMFLRLSRGFELLAPPVRPGSLCH